LRAEKVLGWIISRGLRRGRSGDLMWLWFALGAWIVRRTLRSSRGVIWSGKIKQGERVVVTAFGPGGTSPDPG
jgi:hypothetical protein